jgi:hypothetical protein
MAEPQSLEPDSPERFRMLEAAITELDRELNVRKRCYDGWVSAGKLTVFEARERLERLQDACRFLLGLYEKNAAQPRI